jgi:hypothetical protein
VITRRALGADLRQTAWKTELSLIPIALHHFLKERDLEFIEDPDAFRIPTEGEDDIVDRLLLSVEQEVDPDFQ